MAQRTGTRVSVVVPACPSGENLARCLRSLVEQDRAAVDVEVLVLASESDAAGMARAEQILSPRSGPYRVVASAARTPDDAWLEGLSLAAGSWVLRVDADDWLSPDFVSHIIRGASARSISLGVVVEVDGGGAEALSRASQAVVLAPNLAAVSDVSLALSSTHAALLPTLQARALAEPSPASLAAAMTRAGTPHVVDTRPGKFGATYFRRLPTGTAHPSGTPPVRVEDLLLGYGRDTSYVPPATDQLAILYNFSPFTDASASVAVRRLRASATPWNVVSATMVNIRERDASLAQIAAPAVAQHHLTTGPAAFGSWRAVEAFCWQGLEKVAEVERSAGPQRVLYSRAYGAASHLLAALVKDAAAVPMRWTAEFSDPLRKDVHGEERVAPVDGELVQRFTQIAAAAGLKVPENASVYQWAELLPAALADELVFLHDNQLEYVLGYQEDPAVADLMRRKAVLLPHPQPEEALYEPMAGAPLASGVLHLGYFGSFYPNRGIGEVLAALSACSPWMRERVRLHIFSSMTPELAEVAAGLGGLLQTYPALPYGDYLRTLRRFGVLLVNDVDTSGQPGRVNPYLPSKLSDYRGSGVPVWALTEEGSMLSKAGCRYQSHTGDLDGAMAVLEQMVTEHLGGPQGADGASGSAQPPQKRRPWSWRRPAR